MADIKDMTREEIEQYLASMPKDTAEPTAAQETTAAETIRGADGNYNIGKIDFNKMFASKPSKGSKWQATMNALPEDARNYIYQRMQEYKSKGRKLNKYDLREIEHSAKAKFGLPKSFDISSGALFDSTMADLLNGLDTPVSETKQPDTETPPTTAPTTEQKPVEQKSSTTNDDLSAAFKRIKNKQASDADLALFSKYSEEQLKKMGFGPVSIAAIKGKKETQKPETQKPETSSGNSAEESPNPDVSTDAAGSAASKGKKPYAKMGIGKNSTYFVNGEKTDKANYDKAKADHKSKKTASFDINNSNLNTH